MKPAQMTKEQKQKMALIAISVVFTLGLIYRFVITPLVDRHAAAEARRDELKANLDKADMVIRGEVRARKQSKELKTELEKVFATEIPPPDSALAWVSQAINAQARELKLEVGSIAESPGGALGWDSPDVAKRVFKPYTVRVDLSCSFDKIRALVRTLQQSNPWLTVASISVSAGGQDVERPSVEMILEWPTWKDPKRGQNPFAPVDLGKEKKDANKHD